ncbi:MAG: DUF1800 domain-containing protein [Wenzhouxiangellaceae bacterium]|nr:DUF1800 domain-containing protein [Wenzhouxiangellaceae bacterium]
MTVKTHPRRSFLKTTGTVGLAAAGAALLPPLTIRSVAADTGIPLWPARVPTAPRSGALPPLSLRVFHKLAFGPRPDNPANPSGLSDIEYFQSLGSTDAQRLEAWLDEQITGGSDPQVDSRTFSNPMFTTLGASLNTLWNDWHRYEGGSSWQVRRRPFYETQLLTLTRMVHSRWQLREVLADFWHNHFNVDGEEDVVRSTLVAYDRDVIRPHIFGNFREMLEGVVKSAAMMYYLDNRQNSTPNPNENYARELLELHTLGAVENYFGYIPPGDVPLNVDGQPQGYVEADVLEAARLLTGFGIADGDDDAADTGDFLFRSDWHDFGQKTIVGLTVPGTGVTELDTLLDHLCEHRGTAEFVSWKLAVRLIGDDFSASDPLIQQAADVFQNNWQAPDQIEQVVRTLVLSGEFQSRWANKAKRPLEIIASSMRAASADFTFELDSVVNTEGSPFGYYYDIERSGQEPFAYEPPTGYPESRAIWQGTGPLVMSWRAVTAMLRYTDATGGSQYVDVAGITNAAGVTPTPNAITDFWLDRVLGSATTIDAGKRAELVAFVEQTGQASGPDAALTINTGDTGQWSTYQACVRGLVTLITMLPDVTVR